MNKGFSYLNFSFSIFQVHIIMYIANFVKIFSITIKKNLQVTKILSMIVVLNFFINHQALRQHG